MNALVATAIGEIPQTDLRVETKQVEENTDVWVVARECYYTGTQFSDKQGELIRRDVWVTLKRGQAVKAESNL